MPDPSPQAPEPQRTCFVVMGFGKKTDFETGRVLDLNASYQNLIKPAVEAAGLKCIRADEIVHSGLIDVPMYERLLTSDVVVADISTSNRNAIYELGVRHALRPYSTVIIAEDQMMKSPFFDLNHIVIRSYRHLGEDIGVGEMKRFTEELTKAIREIMTRAPELRWDSPVYRFLNGLKPPTLEGESENASRSGTGAHGRGAVREVEPAAKGEAHSEMMRRVDGAQEKGNAEGWLKAKILLEEIRESRKASVPAEEQTANLEDPYILQRLALATYKSNYPSSEEALRQASELLAILAPQTSNDTETLSLWGSLHKRLWQLTKEKAAIDEAVRAYERGFSLRNDYNSGINFAFLLNVRAASTSDRAEAIADFVLARRVRKEVATICENWLKANPGPVDSPAGERTGAKAASRKVRESKYWVFATLAEAWLGLGDEAKMERSLTEALATEAADWMKETTKTQLESLRALLADSPLKYISSK